MTKKERKEMIIKIGNTALNAAVIAYLVMFFGLGTSAFAKLFDWAILDVAFISGCIGGIVFCLIMMIFGRHIKIVINN